MKFCVYTRSFYESPYINFFVEHYVKLGFDKIVILKTDNIKLNLNKELDKYVNIHEVENKGNESLRDNINFVKKINYDWVLSVDIDEILLIDSEFSDIKDFVKSKLEVDSEINVFCFRWAVIHKYDNQLLDNFNDIFKKYKIFKNVHIKSLFKLENFINMRCPHVGSLNIKPRVYFEKNILNDFKAKRFTFGDSSESLLIHILTRSINNLVVKSIETKLKFNKKINNLENFKNDVEENNFDNHKDFLTNIGVKARSPYNYRTEINYDIIENLKKYTYLNPFINIKEEEENIKFVLNKYDIDTNKYFNYIKKIEKIVQEEKKFIK